MRALKREREKEREHFFVKNPHQIKKFCLCIFFFLKKPIFDDMMMSPIILAFFKSDFGSVSKFGKKRCLHWIWTSQSKLGKLYRI